MRLPFFFRRKKEKGQRPARVASSPRARPWRSSSHGTRAELPPALHPPHAHRVKAHRLGEPAPVRSGLQIEMDLRGVPGLAAAPRRGTPSGRRAARTGGRPPLLLLLPGGLALEEVQALVPLLLGLQGVEGRPVLLQAGPRAVVREEDVVCGYEAHLQRVHAALEEAVLAAAKPEELLAAFGVVEIHLHGLPREDLDRAQETVVSQVWVLTVVLEVYGGAGWWVERADLPADPLGYEDAVRVRLDCPVVLQEGAFLLHLAEDLYEHVGVHQSGLAGVPAGAAGLPGVKQVMRITGVHARIALLGYLHELRLGRVGDDRHEAVQRRARHRLSLAGLSALALAVAVAEHGAVPVGGDLDLFGDPSGLCSRLLAAAEELVLFDAGEPVVGAALRLAAVIPPPSARDRHRRPVAQLCAAPLAAVWAPFLDTLFAAARPGAILLEAGHALPAAICAAALRLRAVLPRRRAGVDLAAFVTEDTAGIVAAVGGHLPARLDARVPQPLTALARAGRGVAEGAAGVNTRFVPGAAVRTALLRRSEQGTRLPASFPGPRASCRVALLLGLEAAARWQGAVSELLAAPLAEVEGAILVVLTLGLALVHARLARFVAEAHGVELALLPALQPALASIQAALRVRARAALTGARRLLLWGLVAIVALQ
mmetsp:Transcript_12160/g.33924  ORF Transcript_12160/g.33924 Transcript_12160/m.33924 type:complete len:655 (-) Transcript_12160:291-2255(-)